MKSENSAPGIEAIVERAFDEPDAKYLSFRERGVCRRFGLAVAKAVVEECAKIANETVVPGEGYATSAFIEQKIRALADPRPEGSETK